jgi:dihydroneopterin aldolase
MPLIAAVIEKKLFAEINTELKSAFGEADQQTAPGSHKKLAEAIAKAVAKVIVAELTTSAQVSVGIPTAGSPASQTTVSVGKII